MGEMSDKIWTHNPNYPDCKEPPLSEKDKALNEIECLLEELLSKVEALKEPRPGGPLMKILNLMRSKFIPQGKVIVSDMDFPPAHPAEENDNITSAPFPVDMVEAEPFGRSAEEHFVVGEIRFNVIKTINGVELNRPELYKPMTKEIRPLTED